MTNKKKSMIVISIGLVVLLNVGASMLIVSTLSKSEEVLIIKENLTPRSVIKEEHLGMISMPKNTIPSNIYTTKEEVVGKVVSFDASMFKGMFLYKDALEDAESTSDAPLLKLKENQVAVSMGVDVLKSLGNTLLGGQYVDIVMTLPIKKNNPIVETIFSNVRILALKDRYGLDMSDPKSQKSPAVILLAINHHDANDFYLAKNKGQIDLVPLLSGTSISKEAIKKDESIIWSILYE